MTAHLRVAAPCNENRSVPARPPDVDLRQGERIQHTVRYTELSPTRFKDFWRD